MYKLRGKQGRGPAAGGRNPLVCVFGTVFALIIAEIID
jgi:hypothetical protein